MAKYERRLTGDLDELLDCLHNNITQGSASASFEEESNITIDQIRVAVRVYERYSMAGGNRVSLSITAVASGKELFISAITSGGSQAVFFKMNTWGEETFLEVCKEAIENYCSRQH
jgi:hypothetical protein